MVLQYTSHPSTQRGWEFYNQLKIGDIVHTEFLQLIKINHLLLKFSLLMKSSKRFNRFFFFNGEFFFSKNVTFFQLLPFFTNKISKNIYINLKNCHVSTHCSSK
jgi:hypothetical protein